MFSEFKAWIWGVGGHFFKKNSQTYFHRKNSLIFMHFNDTETSVNATGGTWLVPKWKEEKGNVSLKEIVGLTGGIWARSHSQRNDHCLCVCVTLQRGLLIRYSSRKCLAILAVLSCWDLVCQWGSFTLKDALQAFPNSRQQIHLEMDRVKTI